MFEIDFQTMTCSLGVVVFALSISTALTQLLLGNQYDALMDVYDMFGETSKVLHSGFVNFFFFFCGCPQGAMFQFVLDLVCRRIVKVQ